jgi:transposase-like protein
MSTPVTSEVRAEVLSNIKDKGIAIEEAATTYNLHPDTIRKWLRLTADNMHTSSSELQRLRRENQVLKEIIGSIVLEREITKKNFARS